jgi:hypothetical protein
MESFRQMLDNYLSEACMVMLLFKLHEFYSWSIGMSAHINK